MLDPFQPFHLKLAKYFCRCCSEIYPGHVSSIAGWLSKAHNSDCGVWVGSSDRHTIWHLNYRCLVNIRAPKIQSTYISINGEIVPQVFDTELTYAISFSRWRLSPKLQNPMLISGPYLKHYYVGKQGSTNKRLICLHIIQDGCRCMHLCNSLHCVPQHSAPGFSCKWVCVEITKADFKLFGIGKCGTVALTANLFRALRRVNYMRKCIWILALTQLLKSRKIVAPFPVASIQYWKSTSKSDLISVNFGRRRGSSNF